MDIKNIIKFLEKNEISFTAPGCYSLPKEIIIKAIDEFIKTGDSDLIEKHKKWTWYGWEDLKNLQLEELYKYRKLKLFWCDYDGLDLLNTVIEKSKENIKFKNSYKYKRKKGFTERLKKLCKKRDDYKCVKCGNNKSLEVDHIIPLIKDGGNLLENLQTLCKDCHKAKTKKDLK